MTTALNAERAAKSAPKTREEAEKTGAGVERGNGDSRKKKITISLSQRSMRAFEELKKATDADTDSEVFRNALRLHLTLMRAHAAGVKLFMKRDGGEECVPVTLFADGE